MTDKIDNIKSAVDERDAEQVPTDKQDEVTESRRAFLIGLGKWSRAVIAGAIVGGGVTAVDRPAQAGWLNRRGSGGGWINGGGSWINGGGGWVNGGGSWINGGGGGWANRRGGWGGSWINVR